MHWLTCALSVGLGVCREAFCVFVILFVVAAVSKHDSTMYDRIIGLIRVSRGAGSPEPDEEPSAAPGT